jgi:hypothetical protein
MQWWAPRPISEPDDYDWLYGDYDYEEEDE